MYMMKPWRLAIFTSLIVSAYISGCSQTGSSPNNTAGPNADKAGTTAADTYTGGPVEVTFGDNNAVITDDEFNKIIVPAVKAKYPDIQVKLVKAGAADLEAMVTAGATPDIIAISNPTFVTLKNLDIPEELDAVIKRLSIDLGRVDPTVVNEIKRLVPNQAIMGVPFSMNYGASVYNKDLFDKFGIPYPKEGLTWEDFLDIAKKLTRVEGGNVYIGASPFSYLNMLKQYGVSNFDAKDENVILTTDKHKYIFSMLQQYFQIPGYVDREKSVYLYRSADDVMKNGKLGIHPGWIGSIKSSAASGAAVVNWELTTFPVFKDRPNVGAPVDFHMAVVSKASKHKEAAYRVISTLLTDEVQMALSRNGRLTVLTNQKTREAYASDSQIFKGKNLAAIFRVAPSPVPDYSKYKDDVTPFIDNIVKDLALKQSDVNTVTRQYEGSANQAIRNLGKK